MAAGGAGSSGVPNIEFYGFVGKDESTKNAFLSEITAKWKITPQISAGTRGCVKILNIGGINYYVKGQFIGYKDSENPLGCELIKDPSSTAVSSWKGSRPPRYTSAAVSSGKRSTGFGFSHSSPSASNMNKEWKRGSKSSASPTSSRESSPVSSRVSPFIQQRYIKYKNEIEMNLFVTEKIPTYVSKCIGGIIIDTYIVYIIFEHNEGTDLEKYIDENNKITLIDIETIIYKLSKCIKELHKLNILHKDINPKNIFYTNDKNILLIDFGSVYHMKKVADDSEMYLVGFEIFTIHLIYKSLLKKFYISPSTENTKLNQTLEIVSHDLLTFKRFKEIVIRNGSIDPRHPIQYSDKPFLKNTFWPPEIPNSEISLNEYLTARDVISLDEMYILINNLIIAVNNVHCNYRTQNTININTIMCTVDKISLSGDSTLMTFENIRSDKQNIIEYQKNIFEYFSVVRYIFLHTLEKGPEYEQIKAIHAALDSTYDDWYRVAFPPEEEAVKNDVGGNIILPGISVRRRKYRSRKMVQRRNRKTRRN